MSELDIRVATYLLLADEGAAPAHVHGRAMAKSHLAPLRQQLGRDKMPVERVLVLDFNGIASCTASYLKGTILSLIRAGTAWADQRGTPSIEDPWGPRNLFPLVGNLSEDVREELTLVLRAEGLVCLEALRWSEQTIASAQLHGPLDSAHKHALDLLVRLDGATAISLHKHESQTQITVTAWSNRLADLHRFRIAWRQRAGRQWVYTSLAKEIVDGRTDEAGSREPL